MKKSNEPTMRCLSGIAAVLFASHCFAQNNLSRVFPLMNPENTYAAIISNETYQKLSENFVPDVTHAILEGERFRQQLIRDYKVPRHNISFQTDANETQIKLLVTKIARLSLKKGDSTELIIYYTGKYAENKILYLLPSGISDDELNHAVGLDYLFKKLEKSGARKISILLDAETVQMDRKVSLLTDGGVHRDATHQNMPPNTVVLTATLVPHTLHSNSDAPELPGVGLEGIGDTLKDEVPPVLTLISPRSLETVLVNKKNIFIRGEARDNRGLYIVSVNGREAHLNEDGSFKAKVSLQPGPNRIFIQAIDINKNITSREITIHVESENTDKPVSDSLSGHLQNPAFLPEVSYHALLMGVNEYEDPMMPNLDFPLSDVKQLNQTLLNNYSFTSDHIYILENPTRQEIIGKFDELEQKLSEKDNLLIFYAGHGTWNPQAKRGYWLPANAQKENTANWIRNSTISGYISSIQSKHTLLVADACFSGGIFKTRGLSESPGSIQRIYKLSSRKAMTSGTLQKVPDKSVFIKYFIKRLSANTDKYITAEQLFYSFKPAVINNCENIPQYGVIKNAGDEGGDFIFIRK